MPHARLTPPPRQSPLRLTRPLCIFLLQSLCFLPITRAAIAQQEPPRVQTRRDDYPRVSPFDDVRWPALNTPPNTPQVRIDGAWYTVVSIDGLPLESILAKAAEIWSPRDVQRRFDEDLGEIMTRLGTKPGQTATLILRDESGAEKKLTPLMTAEKRRRLRDNRAAAEADIAAQAAATPLPESQVRALYTDFIARLASSHAFTIVAPPDVRAALDALPATARATPWHGIRADLTRALARTGDGHASLSIPPPMEGTRFLHCIVEPVGPVLPDPASGRFAAILPDRSGFIDVAHPFVVAIDGRPIADLITAASAYIADGSPQLVRRRAARTLLTPILFELLPAPAPDDTWLTLTLASDAGAVIERDVRFDTSIPQLIPWPAEGPPSHRIIATDAGSVGYLRISSMDDGDAFTAAITRAFDAFAAASSVATIIDVRGNGGGRRDLIDIIGPRLLAPDAPPLVYNASRPVLLPDESPEQRAERMASRYLFPADHPRWSDADRAAITAFAASFKPTLTIPDDRFGPWHYALIAPAPASIPRPTGPTIVLLDAGCFSATDIFLGAMREIPGVTLVGEPSSGGSGLIVPHVITSPDQSLTILLRLSSMLSFQPGGQPYDGVGILPHVAVPTVPSDRLVGGTDSALDAALHTAIRAITDGG